MALLARLRKLFLYLSLKAHYIPIQLLLRVILWVRRRQYPWPANISPLSISGPSGKGRLALYLHSPASETKGPKPVHINLHGGGFVLPLLGLEQRFCSYVCKEAGCYVVDADYRMAPDHPFPAAYDDAWRVLEWVRANEGRMFDPEKVTMGGFSAGGTLALAVAGTAEAKEIKGVVVHYPAVDFTVPYCSKPAPPTKPLANGRGHAIAPREGDKILAAYTLGLPLPHTREQLADPRLSPCFAPAANFPGGGRTMIMSCEYDYLGPEGSEMVKKLEEAGREPVGVWMDGYGHGWDLTKAEGTDEARRRDELWGRAVGVIRKAQAGDV